MQVHDFVNGENMPNWIESVLLWCGTDIYQCLDGSGHMTKAVKPSKAEVNIEHDSGRRARARTRFFFHLSYTLDV